MIQVHETQSELRGSCIVCVVVIAGYAFYFVKQVFAKIGLLVDCYLISARRGLVCLCKSFVIVEPTMVLLNEVYAGIF